MDDDERRQGLALLDRVRPERRVPADEDPRFTARRAAVAARQRRERAERWLLLLLLPALIGLAGWLVFASPLFDVDRVTVTGAAMTGRAGVVAASGVEQGRSLATVDSAEVEERLEALPWVLSAELARSWPGTVRIAIVERRPLAQVAEPKGGWFLIDPTGRLLDAVPDRRDDLITLDGLIEGAAPGVQLGERGTAALAMFPRFPTRVRAHVERVQIAANGTVSFYLKPTFALNETEVADLEEAVAERKETDADAAAQAEEGTPPPEPLPIEIDDVALDLGIPEPLVRFGNVERVDEKLITLETVLARVDPRCLLIVDLRVPRVATVERRVGCEE